MGIFEVLALIGGLCLFLYGMNVMGQALERRAGNSLRNLLGKLTTNKLAGLLTGLGVTAIIQSSSATTVMVVGFVNSGLMTLKQAINVIMGANIGTTVTAWILSLGGIDSSNTFVQLLKPTSFTPVLALIGIIFFMFCKSGKKKDTGTILLGFAVLMFGMDTMSNAVSGLKDVPQFAQLFIMFKNPIFGVLAGAILTAIIQSSSASVGILQALSATGKVSYGAAIPIIMGQNIGTCITAILSSVGTSKNAKRAALVHLSFNIIGTIILLAVFTIISSLFPVAMLDDPASYMGIAVAHSVFNILCTVILFPMSGALEKLVKRLVPDNGKEDVLPELEERLLATPALALQHCHNTAKDMAETSIDALKASLLSLKDDSEELTEKILKAEALSDHYEDIIGSYLVKLSSHNLSEEETSEIARLLKAIGDFERISDHAVNIMESAQEMRDKEIGFSDAGQAELDVIVGAVSEIVYMSLDAFKNENLDSAANVEPLEQIIDDLKNALRASHIARLQQGLCTIEAGFIWSDLLTNLERTSDHCSNIAGVVLDFAGGSMNIHESLSHIRTTSNDYKERLKMYSKKYSV